MFWRRTSQECLSTLGESSGSSEAVWALALSKDSSVLFSAAGDCTIKCWRVRQARCSDSLGWLALRVARVDLVLD